MSTSITNFKWDLERCHYEICSYCESFEAVKKLSGGKYICQTCNESSVDLLSHDRQKESEQNDNTNERTETKRAKRSDTTIPKREISVRTKKAYRIDSSKAAIMIFLNQNSNKAFTTLQIIEQFPQFGSKVVRNSLGAMVREGDIYSRVIVINGKKHYCIYSVTEAKIEELLTEETGAKILETVKKNTYCTIRTLVETLSLSDYNIRRIIKRSLTNAIKIFENKGMYYFIDAKDEEKIKFFKKKHTTARAVNQTSIRN